LLLVGAGGTARSRPRTSPIVYSSALYRSGLYVRQVPKSRSAPL